eukprot:COSAG01_NODE_483_length_16412_cov_17.605162_3_plen_50_part_00
MPVACVQEVLNKVIARSTSSVHVVSVDAGKLATGLHNLSPIISNTAEAN